MGEELKRCPWCAGPAKTLRYNGALQATCAGDHECPGTDVCAPVAAWNRRTPSPAQGKGERWEASSRLGIRREDAITPGFGPFVAVFHNEADRDRSLACVNALRGVKNPEEAVREVREALEPLARRSDQLHSGFDDGIAAGDRPMVRVFVSDLRRAEAALALLTREG